MWHKSCRTPLVLAFFLLFDKFSDLFGIFFHYFVLSMFANVFFKLVPDVFCSTFFGS
jgi:hypothetical protein